MWFRNIGEALEGVFHRITEGYEMTTRCRFTADFYPHRLNNSRRT